MGAAILTAVNDELQQIQAELRPGERLLWSGRPDAGVLFTRADAFLVPFSFLFVGFSVFWVSAAVRSANSGGFWLFGLIFVGFGLYYLVGRFFVKVYRKKHMFYALTSSRAIVLDGARELRSSPVSGVAYGVWRSANGRHATVTFGQGPSRFGQGQYANTGLDFLIRGDSSQVAFYDVPDPDVLLAEIRGVRI